MKIVSFKPYAAKTTEIENRLVSLAEIKPVLTSNYMIKGWLDRNCLSVVYGPSNVGKTFVALDLAMHVAAGMPWRGLRVNGGLVLYIATEGGAGIRNRLAAIIRDRPEMASASFTLLPIGLDLHGSGDALALCEAMPADDLALVVVDTLARSMGAGDENTARDMAMFIRNCDLIRQATGAHVMVIHHTGKDEDRGARGSSALRAAVDNEIQVTADRGIVSRKQRDQMAPGPLYFSLRSVTLGKDEDGDLVTSAVVDAAVPPKPKKKPLKASDQKAMQALFEALEAHGEFKEGFGYPIKQKVISIKSWRDACGACELTNGKGDSALRTAFKRARESLNSLGRVREQCGYVWAVYDDF